MSILAISFIVAGLSIIHFGIFVSFVDLGVNILLLAGHLFFLALGFIYAKNLKSFKWSNYLCGYLIIFILIFALAGRHLLFILALFSYSALFHKPRFLGFLAIFLLSILILTAYWIQAFFIGSLLYVMFLELVKREENTFHTCIYALGFVMLALILFPLLYLLFQSSPQTILSAITPKFKQALTNSLFTASISTLIILIFGVPLGYCLAKKEFRSKPLIDALVDLPILIPQTAAGIAILVFLGPKAPLGEFFSRYLGITFSGSHFAIIACQVFVSMPFLVRAAQGSFQDINPKLENISRTLGASPVKTFFKVSLPIAAPGIFNGCVLSFSRALSEAGSLMIIAYRPFTIPIYANDIFLQYGTEEAVPVTIAFMIICLWAFIVLKWLYERRKKSILAV